MKPLIGIVSKPYKGQIWNYIQAVDEIREALIDNGARVISIIPQGDSIENDYENYPNHEDYDLSNKEDYTSIVDLCDGIVMQGGGVICNYEHLIINYCIEKDIPILGICCGMTNMAFVTGGDVDYSKKEYMKENHLELSGDYKHKVKISEDSLLYKIIGKKELMVNSIHGGIINNSGKYKVTAYSDDGLIEGLEYTRNKFNMGVQWHPELLRKKDGDENRIFEYFVDFVKKNKFA